jgi:isopentenyl-diphosphate delta-isomerase
MINMSPETEQVILVDEQDQQTGVMNKLEAHQKGSLHRAFSVFILNDKNELLLQQRADTKYHSPGLWSNTCCSHPAPGETTLMAAHRRLQEEMGFDCELKPMFTLRYESEVGDGLTENEYDHIYYGSYNGSVTPAEDEVQEYKFAALPDIMDWIEEYPEDFTAWFHIVLPKFVEHLRKSGS